MINRYKWCVCCVLALFIQFHVVQIVAQAAEAGSASVGVVSAEQGGSKADAPAAKSASELQIKVTAGRETAAPGETVTYKLTVRNTSQTTTIASIRLIDVPPVGFKYKAGSVRINGSKGSEPVVSSDGKNITFTLSNLAPASSAIINFDTFITANSKQGRALNYASAISSNGGNSNVAKAALVVSGEYRDVPQEIAVPEPTPIPVEQPKAAAVTAPAPVAVPLPVPAVVSSVPVVTEPAAPVVDKVAKAISPTSAPTPAPVAEVVSHPVIAPPAPQPIAPAIVATNTSSTPVVSEPVPVAAPVAEAPVASLAPAAPAPVSTLPVEVKASARAALPTEFAVPEVENLAKLVGKNDISVLADADGTYVKSMAENRIFENEVAGQVTETTLVESIRAGRSFNRDSLAALTRTEQAKAQTGQAMALLLPSVAVKASTGYETSSPSVAVAGKSQDSDTHLRTDLGLTIRQPLFDLPSFLDWQRRKVVEQARGESYRVSDGDAYFAAVNAYLALVSSRLQTDMTSQFENQLNELLVYVEKRASAGAASNSDMARVRARSQATLSSRLEQESAHAAAGVEFVRLTNVVPKNIKIPALEDVGLSLLPKTLDMAVSTAMKYNPELTSIKAESEAAILEQSAAKGRYYPRVDAEYTDNLSLHAGGDPSAAGQRDQRIMMVLNWNLYSGGGDAKTHTERVARHKELQYRMDDQRRKVVQALSANYATLATTRERITSGYQELKSISTAAEAMSKRMLSGNQSLLDLLDVYDRFYQVRSRLVNLHILEMSTVAQLVRITRGAPEQVASGIAVAGLPDAAAQKNAASDTVKVAN